MGPPGSATPVEGTAQLTSPGGSGSKQSFHTTGLPNPNYANPQPAYHVEQPQYRQPAYQDSLPNTYERRPALGPERLPALRSVLDMPLPLPGIQAQPTAAFQQLEERNMATQETVGNRAFTAQGSHIQDPSHLAMGENCQLIIRQSPRYALVVTRKEKGRRKAIEPPPIIQFKTSLDRKLIENSHLFVSCSLLEETNNRPTRNGGAGLLGTLVSSAHRLLDIDNSEGTFFIFDDLSAELVGTFRLHFILYELRDAQCYDITSVVSESFTVHTKKTFPGIMDSTPLTRSFADQGVRLKISKDRRHLGVATGMR